MHWGHLKTITTTWVLKIASTSISARKQARETKCAIKSSPQGEDEVQHEKLYWLPVHLSDLVMHIHALLSLADIFILV